MDNFQLEQLNQLNQRKSKKLYWNPETLDYFKDFENEIEMLDAIAKFVWEDCTLEEDETFEDLAQDILRQVKEL